MWCFNKRWSLWRPVLCFLRYHRAIVQWIYFSWQNGHFWLPIMTETSICRYFLEEGKTAQLYASLCVECLVPCVSHAYAKFTHKVKQNYNIFLIKFEFGNFSLPLIFHFPFPSLLSEYNTEKHSPAFHSCLPSWPDELGKGKTSACSPGPAVKTGVLRAPNTWGVLQRRGTSPSIFCPAGGSAGPLYTPTPEAEEGLGLPYVLTA